MVRRTSLGLAVQEYLDRGELVPDHVVPDMVREELEEGQGYRSFLPRPNALLCGAAQGAGVRPRGRP